MIVLGPGVRVRCIHKGQWICMFSGREGAGPAYGSIWTIAKIERVMGIVFLRLAGWPDDSRFRTLHFVPLGGDAELARLRAIAKNPKGFVELPSREPAEVKA